MMVENSDNRIDFFDHSNTMPWHGDCFLAKRFISVQWKLLRMFLLLLKGWEGWLLWIFCGSCLPSSMECSLSALWLTSSLENHTKPWTFLFVCFCKNEWPRWEHSALSLIPCFHSPRWHRVTAGLLILSRMRPRQPETSSVQGSPRAQVKAPFWVLLSFSHHCKNPSDISKESSEIYKRTYVMTKCNLFQECKPISILRNQSM